MKEQKIDRRFRVRINNSGIIDLSMLSDTERNILKAYYGIGVSPKTLQEIGKSNNVSKEYVRQMKESGIRKILESLSL